MEQALCGLRANDVLYYLRLRNHRLFSAKWSKTLRTVRLQLVAGVVGFYGLAHSASADVTTYTDNTAFEAAASGGLTSYAFPDMGNYIPAAPSYTLGPVTFASNGLRFFDVGPYGQPYIADDNGGADAYTFTISSTTSALGLELGAYFYDTDYSYVVNEISGSVTVPSRGDRPPSTFLGFITSSGPVSVTFSVPDGAEVSLTSPELDVASFEAGATVSSAPEPSTWVLMLSAVGIVGGALRRVRRRGVITV